MYLGNSLVAPASASLKRFGVVQVSADGQSVVSSKIFDASSAASFYFGGLGVDPTGSRVYLAGVYWAGTVNLDSNVLPDQGSNKDVFYAGYRTSDGVVTMHGKVGNSGTEYMQGGGGVAVDYSGNPFIAFDSGSATLVNGATTYTNAAIDTYLVKSNPAGDWP